MGVLDDAIRQHLELKRKHGAPEEELQRQEDEALGPARREVTQQPEDADVDPGEVDAEPDEAVAAEALEPKADHPPAPGHEQPMIEPLEPVDEAHAQGGEPIADDEDQHEPFGSDEPFSEEEPEQEEEVEDGDVLEDTPDFLQETPEHDRLWFEQKPPRDFDFD
jgi:hypothetical protein